MEVPSLLLQPPGQQGVVFPQAQPGRGFLPGKEQEAAADLLLKAGEGPAQEFGQKCLIVDVAAPIQGWEEVTFPRFLCRGVG